MRTVKIVLGLIFLPGAYIRGFWEHITCRILKLQVEDIGYIRLDEAIGHTEHSLPETQWGAWLMSTGPGFMNFNMGFTFLLFGIMNLRYMGVTFFDSPLLFILSVISTYLGVSLLVFLFPLTEDILNFFDIAYGSKKQEKSAVGKIICLIGKIIAFPFAIITRFFVFLDKFCITHLLLLIYLLWQFGFFEIFTK